MEFKADVHRDRGGGAKVMVLVVEGGGVAVEGVRGGFDGVATTGGVAKGAMVSGDPGIGCGERKGPCWSCCQWQWTLCFYLFQKKFWRSFREVGL